MPVIFKSFVNSFQYCEIYFGMFNLFFFGVKLLVVSEEYVGNMVSL